MSENMPAWNVHLTDEWRSDALDLLADESLPGRWTRRWLERPAWPQVQDIDDRWITSMELEDRTRQVAQRLLGAGLKPGDRFVVSASATADLVVVYIAALRAGLVVVPLNTGYTRAEVERIVADAQPAGAAVDDRERAAWISEAAAGEPVIVGIEVELAGSAEADLDRVTRDDPALLVYTSGTTGRPKGALLTHGNMLASATAVSLAWRWQPDDRLLLTLPLFHVHGLAVGINGTFTTGASVVLRPRFDVTDVFGRADAGAVSLFFGVPAMYQRLASTPGAAALRRLRLCVSGSAPLPPTVANAIAAATGHIPLERYGMTETIMLTSNPYAQRRKVGTVGFPFPGVELRLGDAGEVEVRGPNVISGYWQQPAATAQAFTADGWFRTGDLGEFDEDGYLRLVGRSKDLIITGGYNVYPREVEEVLLTHPGVQDAAVVGRSSDEWGEEVTAVVIADGDLGVDELRAHAAENLAAYKVPKRIEFVDDLPRNALGKVLRQELR
ncbi:MAG: AMP-binding protein [Nitriliruptorales bacterium]|nr:AMP-binding protein [Nitriliruptorales bacterium]